MFFQRLSYFFCHSFYLNSSRRRHGDQLLLPSLCLAIDQISRCIFLTTCIPETFSPSDYVLFFCCCCRAIKIPSFHIYTLSLVFSFDSSHRWRKFPTLATIYEIRYHIDITLIFPDTFLFFMKSTLHFFYAFSYFCRSPLYLVWYEI